MKIPTTKVLSLAAVLVLASASPALGQDHAGHQHADQDRPTGMRHEMMEECPMEAGHMMGMMMGGMMGPDALLAHAEELELTEGQVAELEGLAERSAELHAGMREMMGSMHEVLTSEQMELMREQHGEGMRGMEGMEGMQRMMQGMMRGMDRGMVQDMDHGGMQGAMGEGMMGHGAMDCRMMQSDGDTPEEHPHSR